jgi:hypothetical protein
VNKLTKLTEFKTKPNFKLEKTKSEQFKIRRKIIIIKSVENKNKTEMKIKIKIERKREKKKKQRKKTLVQ